MLRHLAIIMDGNGRWAAERGLPRTAGHAEGVKAVRHALTGAVEAGIKVLTLYSFSSENWKRPSDEIAELMRLHREYLASEGPTLHAEGVRLRFMGDIEKLDPDLCRAMKEAEALTANNSRITLNMAMNYGSQQEITLACRALAVEVATGQRTAESITPTRFAAAHQRRNAPQ
jgi:undecaprenyl diphosphate synthase